MNYQRSSLRYAHTTGHTGLVYTEDGEFIVTCGSDGDLRRWRGIDDDDPVSNCLGEFVMCIAHVKDRLLASTDRNTLQAYTFPSMDNDGTLMRFTGPVTCLRVGQQFTVAGSEDTTIKAARREGETQGDIELQGHTGPILSLDVCDKADSPPLVASIAGDGTLKIWNLESGTEVKSIVGLPKTNSFENTVCFGTPRFEPAHGNSLAYVRGKEIHVLNTSTWEVQCTLTDENASGHYTCCEFSPDGQYLAAGTNAGGLSVFDFVRKQAIKCEAPTSECKAITCIAWHPANNKELAFCDATGQLGTLFAADGPDLGSGAVGAEALGDGQLDFDDIDFDGDDGVASAVDDMDGDDNQKRLKALEVGDEDSDDSLSGTIATSRSVAAAVPAYMPKMFKQQSPFQPSSTPDHLEHRYMAWNDVGIVTAHTGTDAGGGGIDGSIDVEFHDASVHHALHIPNYNNHTMASLSSTVLALSGVGASKLVGIALAAAGNREWSLQMPDCETVEAIAATSKLVAVVTSMQFMRLFTTFGSQREVLSLPGPVVCMAGHEERLLVVYHSAPANEKQQHLGALMVQCHGLTLRSQQIAFPLPAGRQLRWVGFSDCGSPLMYDSMGLLQLYNTRANCWYPICDSMKQSQSVSNNYFVIAVAEKSQIVQAVLCRGCTYPMTNPRPMLQELTMQLPLCDIETEKSTLEDSLMRASMMSVDGGDKLIKETAIKLFALACRSEIEMRAKELIETIACPDLLMLAVKYATKLGRIHLADRLSELMPQIEEEQTKRERKEQEELALQQSMAFVPLQRPQSPCGVGFGSGGGSAKLAPKTMELSMAKRASLKRFALNSPTASPTSTSTSIFKKATESSTAMPVDTQENIFGNHNEPLASDIENQQDGLAKDMPRSPFSGVNPFAAKRKIAEVDKGGILMGANKLKFARK